MNKLRTVDEYLDFRRKNPEAPFDLSADLFSKLMNWDGEHLTKEEQTKIWQYEKEKFNTSDKKNPNAL